MVVRIVRVAFVVLIAVSAAAQLNPTVKLLDKPSGPVPAECEDGRAPQPAPRVEVVEIPVVRPAERDLQAPPSRDLRADVRIAQAAAEANDRLAFKNAVGRIKAMLAGYPPGGERDAATEVMSVYNDLDRLWDFLFESPTGSFFAESSDIHKMMGKYRGYEESVRRQVITDTTGTRFYPTAETKTFLTREAAQRLSRFGFPAPPPQPRPRIEPPAPLREVPARTTSTGPAPRSDRPRATSAAKTPRKNQPRPTSRASRPRKSAPAPVKKEAPPSAATQSAPAAEDLVTPGRPVVAQADPSPAVSAPRAAPPQVTTTTAAPPPQPEPAATETTATTSTAAPAAQGKGRNVILPIMLILIGVGVLIVLFRTSA
jgi:hypothetical protein